ncbi:hypothetical protein BN2127_JRS3_00490 [Bacillus safensis]|nr:hypothetical protein BN2127_JRS3_00490 [Bacillus safensis]
MGTVMLMLMASSRKRSITTIMFEINNQQVFQLVLMRDNYLCQSRLKQDRVVPAVMVHHIVELKQDWNKRLDLNNLESMCNSY